MTVDLQAELESAAETLRNAYTGGPIEPLRDLISPTDVDAAYRIQAINTGHWLSGGREVVGYKIGLTARVVQQQLGVDQPDFGVLFRDMAVANGDTLAIADLIQPRGEAEIALILGESINTPDVSAEGVKNAVEFVVPAIEIVDSRIVDWRITFADTVADNGSSARFVLGDARLPIDGLDLFACGMVLEVDGEVASVGAGAACLGHPLEAAAWLARTMIERGQPLEAGQIILTGALGPMVDLGVGQNVRATIGGIGSVSFDCGSRYPSASRRT